MLDGRSILITGGTGSFGRAFVRDVLTKYKPRRLVIFSRDEQKQFAMARELSPEKYPALRYFIGDVRDRERLRLALRGIDVVIHAAAMKHVPIAEYNPFECIRTNVLGAENVILASIDAGVKKVIALSTDKAANPINLYGATKLCSDKCFVAGNHMSGEGGTRFSVVRYGNVVGSRGSVVEFFQEQVKNGVTELPITDERMTRFFLTIKQGVDFVLDRLVHMQGGEIFIPKIPSMRIVDLARAIGPDCTTKEVGIRPGEKLHEVLLPYDEARNTLEFTNHYTVHPALSWFERDQHLFEDGELGRALPPDFKYASDSNPQWMDPQELLDHLAVERPLLVA
ncbi:MAG: UDP-N-acetylglucosamine 4,6-dehydratase [Planctomycetota bacterium]|jgi:UDP-N-acetylglucosamine 4,6-dehydratase